MSTLAAYLIHVSYDGVWAPSVPGPKQEGLLWATRDSAWSTPELEWHLPMVPQLDVAKFGVTLAVSPEASAGVASILARSGDLLPLGGEAEGWLAFRPCKRVDLVDEERSIRHRETELEYEERTSHFAKHGVAAPSPEIVKYRMFEDWLVPNTVVRAKGILSLVAIEEEGQDTDVTDPENCGFRAWVKHHGVTGVVFKKIWDSTDTVEYDPLWFHKMLADPSYEWD